MYFSSLYLNSEQESHPKMASILSSPAFPASPSLRLRSSLFLSRPSLHLHRPRSLIVPSSLLHEVPFLLDGSMARAAEVAVSGVGEASYSPASYYTSLGLFVISVPGLWSLIKRSVKSKVIFIEPFLSILDFIDLFAALELFLLISFRSHFPLFLKITDSAEEFCERRSCSAESSGGGDSLVLHSQ